MTVYPAIDCLCHLTSSMPACSSRKLFLAGLLKAVFFQKSLNKILYPHFSGQKSGGLRRQFRLVRPVEMGGRNAPGFFAVFFQFSIGLIHFFGIARTDDHFSPRLEQLRIA